MSQLNKTIMTHLQSLSQQAPSLHEHGEAGTTRRTDIPAVSVPGALVTIALECADIAHYSLLLRGLSVQLHPEMHTTQPAVPPTEPPPDKPTVLDALAAQAIAQLHYLEEPLVVCEQDTNAMALSLRSYPPARDEQQITYWEVVVQTGEAFHMHMARYTWAPGMVERETVSYPLTFVMAARLVESLCAIRPL